MINSDAQYGPYRGSFNESGFQIDASSMGLSANRIGVLNAPLGGDREQIIPLVAQNQYQDQI